MMKTRRSMTLLAAAGVLALVACSSTKKPGEDTQRSSSADLGSASQPNSCGSYTGDASFPEGHTGGPATFTGHLTESSLGQNGRFGAPLTPVSNNFDAHSCDVPNPKPTVQDLAHDVRIDHIFLENWTDADACISVWGHDLGTDVAATFQIGAYVGGFEPGEIDFHNVGAGGTTPGQGVIHYAFKVPAHTPFDIVVSAEAPYTSAGIKTADVDVTWTLNVANCGEAGTSGGGTSSSGGTSSGDNGGSTSSSSSSSSSSSGSSGDDAGSGTGKTW